MERIQAAELDSAGLDQVVGALKAGGVVCLPTDTVYGLAVDPYNDSALDRVFELKGRPGAKPILVLVDSVEMARSLSLPNPLLERLAREFWPGPLTIICPAARTLPERLTAGTGKIGMRWPDQNLPTRIIQAFGAPITATSANRSAQPPALSAEEALDQLGQGIDVLIESEHRADSPPSTVVDVGSDPPQVLREGRVPRSALLEVLEETAGRMAT